MMRLRAHVFILEIYSASKLSATVSEALSSACPDKEVPNTTTLRRLVAEYRGTVRARQRQLLIERQNSGNYGRQLLQRDAAAGRKSSRMLKVFPKFPKLPQLPSSRRMSVGKFIYYNQSGYVQTACTNRTQFRGTEIMDFCENIRI
jgi:hypothetical protein